MNHHITKRPDGKWQVKGEGNQRASVVTDTQREAINLGREISRNQRGELFIHGVDGKSEHVILMGMIRIHQEGRE